MSFQDKSLTCTDCGATFSFSAKDQEFFQTKGFTNEPKRCLECRQTKKAERNGRSFGSESYDGYQPRTMYPATCAECGKSTEVPFQPRNDKPVYCSDCFRKIRPTR